MHPFRFAVQVSELPLDRWRERVRWYEDLGFSTISTPDHYAMPQWDPVALQAAVAAATTKAAVGSTVLNCGLRLPIDLARMGATLAAIAAGGCELGLGAGWIPDDYDIAGVPFPSAKDRLQRLDETVQAITSLWTRDSTTIDGAHVQMSAVPPPFALPLPRRPRVLLGGTQQHALGLAGRHADIVSVFPSLASGEIGWRGWAAGSTLDRTAEQTSWARQGAIEAGRDPDELELSTQIGFTAVGDDAQPLMAQVERASGVDAAAQQASTIFLSGTPTDARDHLQRVREATGLSYFVIFDTAFNYANPGGTPTALPGDTDPGAGDRYLESLAATVLAPLVGQ